MKKIKGAAMKINKEYKEYLEDKETKQIILIGGGGSGKSFFVLQQWLLLLLLFNENVRVLVTRKVANTLANSVIQNVLDGLEDIGLEEKKHYVYNRSKNHITIIVNVNDKKTKGNKIAFAGLDDPAKIKSFTGLSHIIMEEGGEYTKKDFLEMTIRTRPKRGDIEYITPQKIIMLNPVDENHAIEELMHSEEEEVYMRFSDVDVEGLTEEDKKLIYNQPKKWKFKEGGITTKVFRSTYVDNAFIDEVTKAAIDNFKIYDYNEFRRYRLGIAEELEEKIFKQYEIKEMKLNNPIRKFGMDFGFMSDPTALIESQIEEDILYIAKEYIYSTQMGNNDIIEVIEAEGLKEEYIIADSAEPKTIDFMQREGLNVVGAKKGAGSIKAGIKKIKSYKILIDPSCTNVIAEFEKYKRKVDKNGKITDIIVDDNNHAIDAIRYSLEEESSNLIY